MMDLFLLGIQKEWNASLYRNNITQRPCNTSYRNIFTKKSCNTFCGITLFDNRFPNQNCFDSSLLHITDVIRCKQPRFPNHNYVSVMDSLSVFTVKKLLRITNINFKGFKVPIIYTNQLDPIYSQNAVHFLFIVHLTKIKNNKESIVTVQSNP